MKSNKNSLLGFFIPLVFLIVLFVLIWKNFNPQQTDVHTLLNKKLPAFDLPTLPYSGNSLTDRDLKGRVILLNFWASWCSACRNEHATLLAIKNNYHIPIYGINYKDTKENAENWLKKQGNPYVISGVDANGTAGSAFDLYGTPETFIIDAQGVIRYIHIGALSEQQWQHELWPVIQKLQHTPQ